MKKSLLAAVSLLVGLTCIGCGGSPAVNRDSAGGNGGNSGSSLKRGSITIAVPMTSTEQDVMRAVINGYRKLNPLVTITIDPSGSSGSYHDTLRGMLSNDDMSKVSADIVRNNTVKSYFGSNKFVDYNEYLGKKNPYADDAVWRSTFDEMALTPDGSQGQIYALSFQSTNVAFFYNKDIFDEVGIKGEDIVTWGDFKDALAAIDAHDFGSKTVVPMSMSGSALSFSDWQMSWIFRTYVDQYFRDVTEEVHSGTEDWNYDPIKDSEWTYCSTVADNPDLSLEEAQNLAWFNDLPISYTYNELKVLKGIMDGEYGPANAKYKSMLANLMDVFPKYCGGTFTSDDSNAFWMGEAAIAIDETSLLVEWKNRSKINPEEMFDIGYFSFPAMEEHPSYPGVRPDVDYTRSIGGPHGYYGIINKSAKQTELVMDFMMYWASKTGQDLEFEKMKELDIGAKGAPYIKGVTLPDEINVGKDMQLRGIADNNPAVLFSRGLGAEPYSIRDFQSLTEKLFVTKPTGFGIEEYATQMQQSMVSNMPKYLEYKGYRSNALDNVLVNPF